MTFPVLCYQMPEASGDLQAQQRKHRWCLQGVFNEVTALAYFMSYVPLTLPAEGLYRQNITPSTPGGDTWFADVQYGPIPKVVGEWSLSGDTTGGTVRVKCSKECLHAYLSTGDTGIKRTLIGLRKDGDCDGSEIIIPSSKRTYTVRYAKGTISEQYMDYLEILTGRTNSAIWHNRAIGEVLYTGSQFTTTQSGSAECSVSYNMLLGRNQTGITIGAIANIAQKAHEVLDVEWEAEPSGGETSGKEKVVRIHRVYDALNFTSYLGF